MALDSLKDLYLDQAEDIFSACKQSEAATRELASAANDGDLKKALEAGVDGIEIYETELQAHACQNRWLVPLFGNRKRLEAFLRESNLEACFPVHSPSAAYGHDNPSFSEGWDVIGSGSL